MGPQWWRKLSLPRRGKKETLLAPGGPDTVLSETHLKRVTKRQARLRKAVEAQRVSRAKHLTIAEWDHTLGMARIMTPRGNALSSMGVFAHGVQWLYPEEAVYLVDRAQLDLRVDGVPASLQRAFGFLVDGVNCITLEEYCAFSHLRRVGYVVRRFGLDSFLEVEQEQEQGTLAVTARSLLQEEVDDDANASTLKPSFSVWRVGGFKRKETHRPIFHILVGRYEDPPPRHAELTELLATCSGKTRVRMALIDRGVVVLIDIANNATPLSTRYTSRLPTPLNGPLNSGPVAHAVNGHESGSSLMHISPVENGGESLKPVAERQQLALTESDAAIPHTSALGVEHVLAAIKRCAEPCSFVDILNSLETPFCADQGLGRSRESGELRSKLLNALHKLARNDDVVLSGGSAPTVYLVRKG